MDKTEMYTTDNKSKIIRKAVLFLKLFMPWFYKCKWIIGGVLLSLLLIVPIIKLKKHKYQLITLQGKNYFIQYHVKDNVNYQTEIETLLDDISQVGNLENKESEIARFNRHDCTIFLFESSHFYPFLITSKKVYNQTKGAFDPTVAPLIQLWKKNLQKGKYPAAEKIKALQEYIGLDYVVVNQKRVKKLKEGVTLHLNSLIASYSVDVIANFLRSKAIKDFCINLDNEALAQGVNNNRQPWEVKHTVDNNNLLDHSFSIYTKLHNRSVSLVFQHNIREKEYNIPIIIDSKTGYLVHGNIIAAAVLADDCIAASAYATAILTKDFENALEMLKPIKNIEVFLIYKNEEDKIVFYNSNGLEAQIKEDISEIYLESKKAEISSTEIKKTEDKQS